MKKLLIIICALLVFGVVMAGCQQNETAQTQFQVLPILVDCFIYNSLDSMTAAADRIVEGRVTNISFVVLNDYTGEPPTASDDPRDNMIWTIYEVQVKNTYKGQRERKVNISVIGGIQGYREAEQVALLKRYQEKGMYREDPVLHYLDGFNPPKIGESYLFLMSELKNSQGSHLINHLQGLYRVGDDTKIWDFSYEDVKSYLSIYEPTEEQIMRSVLSVVIPAVVLVAGTSIVILVIKKRKKKAAAATTPETTE